MQIESLVSIITPCYNAERYIAETIESVLNQTYTNWEMIIVDDCSTDKSAEVIKKYIQIDRRIKYFKTDAPSGSPTLPRNIALSKAKGRYIAFLDADDLFLPTKLQNQLKYFTDEEIAIVFSNYEKIEFDGQRKGRYVIAPSKITYKKCLESGYCGCCTMLIDALKAGHLELLNTPQEDYVFTLNILKKGYIAVNTNTIEAHYRLLDNSRSSNKFKVAKGQWYVLRHIEKLPFYKAVYYFSHYAIKGLIKYLR